MGYKGTKGIDKYTMCSCSYCNKDFERLKSKVYTARVFCGIKCKSKYFSEVEPIKHHKQFSKGIIPWNKGLKGIKTGGRPKGCIPHNKGKTNIEIYGITRAKLLEERNREQALYNINRVNKEDTNIERRIENYLLFNNILYVKQFKYKYGIADFWLPAAHVIIHCDGRYWHDMPKNKKRNYLQDVWLCTEGYDVLRLRDDLILKNFGKCSELICNVL